MSTAYFLAEGSGCNSSIILYHTVLPAIAQLVLMDSIDRIQMSSSCATLSPKDCSLLLTAFNIYGFASVRSKWQQPTQVLEGPPSVFQLVDRWEKRS
jgi:hypothetical protein